MSSRDPYGSSSYGGGGGSAYRQQQPQPSSSRHQRLQPEQRIPPPPIMPPGLSQAIQALPSPSQWPGIAFNYIVLEPLMALVSSVTALILSPRTHRLVLRLGVLGAIFWTATALAVAAYVGFYRAWVPDIGHRLDVWLQYGGETSPWAVVDLTPKRHGSVGQSVGLLFAQDQEYDVTVDLSVPLSAANLDLGNFMVSLDLISGHNATVYSISRPTLLTYTPAPLRAANALAHALTRPGLQLPLSSSPTALVSVRLLRRAILAPASSSHPFTPDTSPITRALVRVGRQDAERYWKYGGGHGVGGVRDGGHVLAGGGSDFRSRGELQTHAVSLRFDAHLTGLRYFMYHHPVASFVIFTLLFLSFELLSALTLWALAALYTSTLTQPPSLAVEDNYVERRRRRQAASPGTSPAATPGETPPSEVAPRDTTETDDEESETETETETEESRRRLSRASLRARDEAERAEAARAEARRDVAEGRRMTAVDLGGPSELGLETGRRVLGRLDEETEEETDVGSRDDEGSQQSFGEQAGTWEEVGTPAEEAEAEEERRAGLRQRKGDDDRESTVGGSATSRASSVRSFGATSYATSRATSTTPTATGGRSASSTPAYGRTASASVEPIEEGRETEPSEEE